MNPLPPIRVALEPSYDIYVGSGSGFLEEQLRALFEHHDPSGVALISDQTVRSLGHLKRVADIVDGLGVTHQSFVVAAGEASKNTETFASLLEQLAAARFDRRALVVAVGGGVVGDLAGFVAACYLRGIGIVQVPSTLLAMVDASIGGKSGINLRAGKNLAGAFWQPHAVLVDSGLLGTLPEANFREGAVELYKHALLIDAPWRSAFGEGASFGLERGDDSALSELIHAGIQVKADVVSRDPLERGERAHLNLGHTLAHALEGATGGAMRHGTAVAYGLLFAAQLGAAAGYADWRAQATALVRWAADAAAPNLAWEALSPYLASDKKRSRGTLRWVVLEELGRPRMIDTPPPERLAQHWGELRESLEGVL